MFTKNSICSGFCLLLGLLALSPWTARAESREYQIKAAFLFNFVQFVTWPSEVFTNAGEPFTIGVLGEDPFGPALEETIQGENINGHKLLVRRSHRIEDLRDCQLIFISKSEKSHLPEIFAGLGSKPILTVSEVDRFAEYGGIINFYLEGNKVRFEINPAAAQHDGLKISSQLLSLGKIVEPAKEGR